MRKIWSLTALSLIFTLVLFSCPLPGQAATASTSQNGTLERGYRVGYSDGYQAGFRDQAQAWPRDYKNKEEYQRADRAYAPAHGALEDYRDGYQQGFEIGYNAGFDRRQFNSSPPPNLAPRGVSSTAPPVSDDNSDAAVVSRPAPSRAPAVVPSNTVLRVELLTNLSTEATQRGDRFQARVIEPAEYDGAMIEGRVTRVKRPGKIKGKGELQLSFEQIRLPDNRWANIEAQLIEVLPSARGDNGTVDSEGGVRGRDSKGDDAARIGASAGVGAVLGAIFGGGKGAAIGAILGGAAGTGSVLTSRGKDIYLTRGTELRIRTSSETRFPE